MRHRVYVARLKRIASTCGGAQWVCLNEGSFTDRVFWLRQIMLWSRMQVGLAMQDLDELSQKRRSAQGSCV